MFITELFEAAQQKTLVIIPGGFHPFHPGHLSLYRSAQRAFPGATIVYAATDDQKERPFAFVDKEKLAAIAGVPERAFQLVKSPFVAREITQNFDPNTTVLIFARSEKDRDEPPRPGGVKKNGEPSYLQPYAKGDLAPMTQHGYMAYLPTVQFDAGPSGVTSATQIRNMWPQADDAQKNAIIADLYPRNPAVARQILDKYLGGGLSESFDKEAFRQQMRDLEAREELRKTDPVSAKALDLRGQLPQKSKKKPEDDAMSINDPRHPQYAYTQAGHQGVAEDYENLTENFGGLSLKAINEILIIIPRITNRLSDTVGPMARDIANMAKLLPKVIQGQASPAEKAFVSREAKEVLQIAVSAWLSHYMTALGKTVGHMMPNELTQKITEYVTKYVGEGVVLKKVFDALQTDRNKQWLDQNAAERAAALQYDKQHPEQDPHLLYKKTRQDPLVGMMEDELDEHIGKVKGGYRLYSHKGKNLGTFPSKAGAEKHEREVEYFKHRDSVNEDQDVLAQLDQLAEFTGIL